MLNVLSVPISDKAGVTYFNILACLAFSVKQLIQFAFCLKRGISYRTCFSVCKDVVVGY